MNTRRLTKKYKYKSMKSRKTRRNRKSRRSGKTRRRVLKGGLPSVRPRGVIVNRTSGSSRFRPSSSSVRPGSVRSGSVRPGSTSGILKPEILSKPEFLSKCCHKISISDEEKIIESINNFPHTFDKFYASFLQQPDDELKKTIQEIKEDYTKKITINSTGEYPNITGLQLISYLTYKYINSNSQYERGKIKNFISLLDQYAAAPGVRETDLDIIRKLVDPYYFECYKKLYEDISKRLFRCGNRYCYPVSTSAISLYCKSRLEPIDE